MWKKIKKFCQRLHHGPALINCPKCHHKVSKTARVCPGCGHPIGVISWITENKLLLLITTMIGLSGLSFVEGARDFLTGGWLKRNSPTMGKIFPGDATRPPREPSTAPNTTTNSSRSSRRCADCGDTRKCTSCGGNAKTQCPQCNRSGKAGYLPCENCQHTGKLTCPRCKGDGTITDWSGGAHRSVQCPRCKAEKALSCSHCQGKGMQRCPNYCRHGYIYCMTCEGKGICLKCGK